MASFDKCFGGLTQWWPSTIDSAMYHNAYKQVRDYYTKLTSGMNNTVQPMFLGDTSNGSNFQSVSNLNNMTPEEIWNYYWWCDLPMMLMNSILKTNLSSEANLQAPPSVPQQDFLTNDRNYEATNKVSKSDMNLELLKDYEYRSEVRHPEGEDKPVTYYICTHKGCNKEFTRTWNILDHARMHKGVKPYKCNFCMKQFTQKGNLRKHMKTHIMPSLDQRKRYKCEYCDSSYTERYNYKVS